MFLLLSYHAEQWGIFPLQQLECKASHPVGIWQTSCKLSGAGSKICREDVFAVIAHRSLHSCRTKTRPLFCFLRDNRSLSPLLPNRPGTIAPKWKPFVGAYYSVSSCLEYNDDFFQLLAAAASISVQGDGSTEYVCVCYLLWFLIYFFLNVQKTV